jgi:AraC-like DNA-binding protein
MYKSPQLMHKTPHSPLRVQLAGTVEFEQGRDVRPHHHPLLELVYYLKGDVQCRIGEAIVDCRPGMLRLMPPGVMHGEISLTAWACHYIWLEPPFLPWPHVYTDDSGGTFGKLCSVLVREWTGEAPDRDEMLGLLLHQIDILLRRAHTQDEVSSAERLVREGERLLKERFATSMTITEVAAALGVSPSYLRAQFVRLRGQTPMTFLQALRVEHALALIRNSDLSLEAIARLCGYDSSSHLSRNLKRATGERPGVFRLRDARRS